MFKSLIQAAIILTVFRADAAFGDDTHRKPREAIVIDFTKSHAPPDPWRPGNSDHVSAAMIAEFAREGERASPMFEGWSSETVAWSRALPTALPTFVREPVAVPAWMRRGGAPFAIVMTPGPLPVIGDCGRRPYSVSGLLGGAGEERRRVLYPLVVQSACRHGLPIGLFDAMIMQESRYNIAVRSPKGAFGLGQLMPGTAAQLGVDRYDIQENLDGSARYLASHLREFRQPILALAAYNAGPGRVRLLGRVPRILETQDYVRQIMRNWQTIEWHAAPSGDLKLPVDLQFLATRK